jgi:2',3'-cyclic-nucleotide 2'-phosphodiesterase (5'-nucleotidase family)
MLTGSRFVRAGLIAALTCAGVVFASPAPPDAPHAGASGVPVVPRSLDVPNASLVAAGAAPEVDLLYTGDAMGYLETCGCKLNPAGGVARRAWLLNQLKAKYPSTPFVLVDSGNFSDNPTEAGDARTAALLDAMVTLGYKAINVGDRDLAFGYDEFVERTHGLPMDFVSTNIVRRGTSSPVFKPYSVVEVTGTSGRSVRIGVLGVIRYSPVWQKAGPAGGNLATAPPADMVRTYLPELRKQADFVVLLAAVSKEDAQDLAKAFPDLDLIVGAYGGIYSAVEETEGRVRIIYVGNQGKRFAESRIVLDARRHVSDIVTYLHFLNARYPEDPTMKAAIEAVKAKIAKGGGDASPAEPAAPAGESPAGGH